MFGPSTVDASRSSTPGRKIQRALVVIGLSSLLVGAGLPLLAEARDKLISERFLGEAGAGAIDAITGARSSFVRGVFDASGGVEAFEDADRARAIWTMVSADGRNLAWFSAGHDWQEKSHMAEEEVLEFSETVIAENEALRRTVELAAFDLTGAGLEPGEARNLGHIAGLAGLAEGLGGSSFPVDKDVLTAAGSAIAGRDAAVRRRLEEAVGAMAGVARSQAHDSRLTRAAARSIDRAAEDHIGNRHGRIIERMREQQRGAEQPAEAEQRSPSI